MRYADKILFENVSLQMNPGNRYGLIGANGAGKSTLLRILMGEENPYSGEVSVPAQVSLGFLTQDHYKYEDLPISQVVMMGREKLYEALKEKDEILLQADISDKDGLKLSELEDIILSLDGYSVEGEVSRILDGLGIPYEKQGDPLKSLSGGYKLRVLLARLLFFKPDVMLLDEPTNHLDIVSIAWLESYLKRYEGTVVLVSHDQHFLNEVCTHIADIDYGEIKMYKGNYKRFEAQKVLEAEQKDLAVTRQDKKRDELQRFVDRFKAKASKAKQAQSRVKMIERMDEIKQAPSSRLSPHFAFKSVRKPGVSPLIVKSLDKAYDVNKVLENISFDVERGDKIAIIGPNGIGKSTLLKILMEELKADQGTFEWGYETHLAYFPQDHAELLDPKVNLIDWLWEFDGSATIGTIRGILGKAIFSGQEAEKKIAALSGGESGRLILAMLMLIKHNVLILDEPTNHLDLETIDQLSHAFSAYDGTILFVSHNRFFVQNIANRILEITPEGLRDFRGSYDEYLRKFGEDYLDRDSNLKNEKSRNKDRKAEKVKSEDFKKQLSYKDQKRFNKEERALKKQVTTLEAEIATKEQILQDNEELLVNFEEFSKLHGDKQRQVMKNKETYSSDLNLTMSLWEKACESLENFPAKFK
ncbi:ATP-binding cassette domain-containing protein [bacterium]|nr:ATP-binding cassette domain-containing protein [bacterium]